MIDNSVQLRALLKFPTEDHFYWLQIIKRRKENPEMARPQEIIKNYEIHNLEDFDKLLPRIKEHCDLNNARAYLRLNLREAKRIAMAMNKIVADKLFSGQYKEVKNAYDKALGGFHSDPDKKWIVDFDGDEAKPEFFNPVIEKIQELRQDAIIAFVPTKNGFHAISRPFNLQEFNKTFPEIKLSDKIHKDNPTILYVP